MYDLPETVQIGGKTWAIRADFRVALEILTILADPALTPWERLFLTLLYFYPALPDLPEEQYPEALARCFDFLREGRPDQPGPPLMDWEQDFPYIMSAVNRVAGRELRREKFCHWWTFLAAYREIGECVFAQIVRIRRKRLLGQRLDPAEAAWYRENQTLVDLKLPLTPEEETLLNQWSPPLN